MPLLKDTGALPATDFTFSQAIGNLWGNIQPVLMDGAKIYGEIEIAKAQAAAQAKLNALKTQNATLGPNDPAAAQRVADKTLSQSWLPVANGPAGFIVPVLLYGGLVVLVILIFKRLLK